LQTTWGGVYCYNFRPVKLIRIFYPSRRYRITKENFNLDQTPEFSGSNSENQNMLTQKKILAALFMVLVSKEAFSNPEPRNPGIAQFRIPNAVKWAGNSNDSVPQSMKKTPWLVERFRLRAGLFVPINNTDVQVSGLNRDPGSDINLENSLGFSRVVGTFLANFQWRISPRSKLNAVYYNIERSSTYTLKQDIVFDSTTFLANSSVNAFFNTAIYQIAYGYSILAKPNYEVGIFIGTHTVGFSTGISAHGTTTGVNASTDFKFTAPLPDLGLWGSYILSNRFALSLDASYLALTIDGTNGRIFSYYVQILYKLLSRLDVSLGFTGLNFKVTKNVKNADGSFTWGYNGPSLSVIYSFGKNNWEHSTKFDGR
jgi:hypothetical protein